MNANENENVDIDSVISVIEEVDSLPPFEAIESNFKTTDLILPEGFTYTVLFSEDDDVTRADGQKFPAKGNHDLSIFIPNKENPNTKGPHPGVTGGRLVRKHLLTMQIGPNPEIP